MDPVIIALASAAIQGVANVIKQLEEGKISDDQAKAILQQGVAHFNASEANWDATQPPSGG